VNILEGNGNRHSTEGDSNLCHWMYILRRGTGRSVQPPTAIRVGLAIQKLSKELRRRGDQKDGALSGAASLAREYSSSFRALELTVLPSVGGGRIIPRQLWIWIDLRGFAAKTKT
jgi:hypothetical protein